MRTKTYYSERPEPYEIQSSGVGQAIIFFRRNIEAVEVDGGTQYSADEYTMTVPAAPTLAARIEADYETWLSKAIQEDRDRAAAEVRAIRDRLLSESDKEMALDRMGIEVPTGTTFAAWLSFLRSLGDMLVGSMAKYRQALRDLPQQEGFPYDVVWPTRPGGKE